MGLREWLNVKRRQMEDIVVNSNVVVNGKVIVNSDFIGRDINITSRGDNVFINDQIIHTSQEKNITIVINGNTQSITTISGDVNVYGVNCGDIKTTSGDVFIQKGTVGTVNTVSGDVSAEKIEGNVKTISGDINTR